MTRTKIAQTQLRDALRGFQDHRRLVAMLQAMACELERVSEDNRQLRAAVKIYREVVRLRTQTTPRARSPLARKKPGDGASAAL